MSTAMGKTPRQSSNKRTIAAIAGCALGLGLIFVALGSVSTSTKKHPSAGPQGEVSKPQKAVRAWNVALGDVVVMAQELGFEVEGATDAKSEQNKIQARIESQLQRLREFYRQESERNPTLMGRMMLQLTIAPSGEVRQVKELGSRIADAELTKTVIAEVTRWSFPDLISEPVIVNCPLLFVREGMDIGTVVQWEKALGSLADKPVLTAGQAQIVQEAKAPQVVKTALPRTQHSVPPARRRFPSGTLKAADTLYQLKYVTTMRTDPTFGAPSVAKLSAGSNVSLISSHGEWLQVRSADGGLSGFIRKEFVTPVEMTRNP